MKKRMAYMAMILAMVGIGMLGWNLTARAGYESAEYKVIQSDGMIEIREYPDLMLAATNTNTDSRGRDGSFMRLFRYISGANEEEQKIAMTTPVFMESKDGEANGSMGFVMPKEIASEGAPEPTGKGVHIRKREGGRFAVIRFSGRMSSEMVNSQEAILRRWLNSNGLEGEDTAEAAGYDPPFTPGPLRRNEVLIRLKPSGS